MNEELRRLVEAILFAAARKIELSEIAKLSKHNEADILGVLTEWKSQLEASPSSATMLVQDGTGWKLAVKDQYLSVVKKVVTKTELPKSILQTLAVVAYKAPVMQSKVIKIRTNKAYDHLRALEESQLITREKKGRSKLIKLTPKFYEYFDVDPRKLRDKFSSSGDLEKAIEAKEQEADQIEIDRQKQTEERLEKPKINLHQGVEVVDVVEVVEKLENTSGVEIVEEKVGELKVYDIPPENMTPEEKAAWDAAHPAPHKKKHHKKHHHATKVEGERMEAEGTTTATKVEGDRMEAEGTTTATKVEGDRMEAEGTTTPTTNETKIGEGTTQTTPPAPSTNDAGSSPVSQEQARQTQEIPNEETQAQPHAPKAKKERKHKEKETGERTKEQGNTATETAQPEKDPLAPIPETPKELSPAEKVHQEAQAKAARLKDKDFEKGEGIQVTPEMETEIERKLKRILSGEEEPKKDETPPPM